MATPTARMVTAAFIFAAWKALISRSLFVIHGLITFWRVSDVYKDPLYYLLLVPFVLLLIEYPVTTKCTRTGEWKWICPSLFLYILGVVPGIWLLQLDALHSRVEHMKVSGSQVCGTYVANTTFGDIQGIQIPLELSSAEWTLALEQILLVLLILGKWLLPRGHLSRDQLAQLLMGYIGVAADSLEFSLESLKEPQVLCDLVIIIIILSIWSWSLLQFCLNTTALAISDESDDSEEGIRSACSGCYQSDIWALIVSVILQDAPYLAMRLFLMIYVGAIHQMMLFFTCKNVLVISLQFYRLGVLCCGKDDVTNAEFGNGEVSTREERTQINPNVVVD
ncbi:transmembrane protein 26-like [Amphiura filiformis]|uniref:transmembrane protein 26-like n=1 Tax=Amphiura filiformis TaxID=82378 RepID=UPI003B20C3B3